MPKAALWLTLKKLKLSSNLNRFVNYRKDLAAVGTMCSHVQTWPRAEWRHSQRQSGEPRGAPGVSNPSAKTIRPNRLPASTSSGRLLNPGRGAEGATGQGSPSPAHSDVGTGAPAGCVHCGVFPFSMWGWGHSRRLRSLCHVTSWPEREQNRNVSDYTQQRTRICRSGWAKSLWKRATITLSSNHWGGGRGGEGTLTPRVPHHNMRMARFSTKDCKNYKGAGTYNTLVEKKNLTTELSLRNSRHWTYQPTVLKVISYILKELKETIDKELKEIKRILHQWGMSINR